MLCAILRKTIDCKSAKNYLRAHNKRMHEDKTLQCNFCGVTFVENGELNAHVKYIHLIKEGLKCELCDKRFESKDNLRNHISRIHKVMDRVFECDKCEKSFAYKNSLENHLLSTHSK